MAGDSQRARRSRGLDRAILVIEALVGLAVVAAIIGKSYGFSSTLVFILCGLAAAFSGYVLIRMLSSLGDDTLEVTGRLDDEQRAALEHEKLLLLQGIKELEADAAVGKVDAEDYHHLRETAEARALQIIHELKESDQRWLAEAETYVAQRLGRPSAAVGAEPRGEARPVEDSEAYKRQSLEERRKRKAFSGLFDDRPIEMTEKSEDRVACGACDSENEVDARFCIGCGRPRRDRPEPATSKVAEGAA